MSSIWDGQYDRLVDPYSHWLLNQPSLVSNFDFFGINSSVAYGENSSLVTVNKLQKYLKSTSQKLHTLQYPSPNGWGFQVKKLVVANLKVQKKCFHIVAWNFFTKTTYELAHQHKHQHTKTWWLQIWESQNWKKIGLFFFWLYCNVKNFSILFLNINTA